jgi:hypothetical protein
MPFPNSSGSQDYSTLSSEKIIGFSNCIFVYLAFKQYKPTPY